MEKIKYPDEYPDIMCEFFPDIICDKTCGIWDTCPREEFDIAQEKFCNKVKEIYKNPKAVEIIKDKRDARKS
jgi:hypothetical protein